MHDQTDTPAEPPRVADDSLAGIRYRNLDRRGVAATIDRLRFVEAERDKLAAFKQWVHDYLDAHAVPHHPPGTHGEHGCRIGDRMDWLMERLRKAEAAARVAVLPVVPTLPPLP